jgi:hypothetical protein
MLAGMILALAHSQTEPPFNGLYHATVIPRPVPDRRRLQDLVSRELAPLDAAARRATRPLAVLAEAMSSRQVRLLR